MRAPTFGRCPRYLREVYTLEHYKPDAQRASGSVFKGNVTRKWIVSGAPQRGGVRIQIFTGVYIGFLESAKPIRLGTEGPNLVPPLVALRKLIIIFVKWNIEN